MLRYVHVITLTHEMITESFASSHRDKEDAIQYVAAKKSKAKYFITRNIKHHVESTGIKVLTPQDFINLPKVKKILNSR